MLDYKKYINGINRADIFELTCPHCGTLTRSAKGKNVFCNFCEQFINISEAQIMNETGTQIAFAEISEAIGSDMCDEAEKKIAQLLKGSEDPKLAYLSALSFLYFSDAKYHKTDYGLRGFMDKNAENIGKSLECTSKSKEYFYKAIKIVKYELGRDVMVDEGMLFIEFMSEIRLRRFVDAARTLKLLHGSGVQSLLSEYADMVYYVEADRVVAEQVLPNLLSRGEINAFYYLAKHLALKRRLGEAADVVKWLNGISSMFLAKELLIKIESAQEASKF